MAMTPSMRAGLVVVFLLLAAPVPSSRPAAQSEGDEARLVAMLQATVTMWNRGDLDGFMAPYDDDTTFMTPAGLIGRDALRERYATRYFTGGRPDQTLRFEQLEVRRLGADHALMTGRFLLTGGGKAEQSGRFTLVWARMPGGWRILHDHSS